MLSENSEPFERCENFAYIYMHSAPNTFRAPKKRTKKEAERISLSLSRLSYPDSNQDRQNQNLQCYHYTIRQS